VNESICSLFYSACVLWVLAFIFLFSERAVRAFLVRFRYRELREDLATDRMRLILLFRIVDDPMRHVRIFKFATILMSAGIGVAWFAIGICFALRFGFELGTWLSNVIFVCWILISAFLHALILGWLPRVLGPGFPRWLLRVISYFFFGIEVLIGPLENMIKVTQRLFAIFGIHEKPLVSQIDRDLQILASGNAGVKFTPVTEKIALRSMDLSEISVYDILLPRNQVQIFDINDGIAANIEKARKTGHTRFPLCRDDLDHCFGFIHIKDIFRSRQPLGTLELEKLARPITRFDQYQPLDRVLQVLLQKRVHMALIEDDFGGILGVITLERILEELVGEIQDEFDKEERMIVPLKKDFYKISGLTPIHEVEDQLGIDNLENDDVSSFGGLITYHLGRIPKKGEIVEIGPLIINILETDETRVILTNVRILSLP
jgi:CBS domain containing-hemolysin-like protein